MPNQQQIARIRAKLAQFLTETATISRLMPTVDRLGVPTEDYAPPHAVDVPCRVIDSRNRTMQGWREVAQTDVMTDMYRIVFAVGTDVDKDCRIVVGGRVYHVVEVHDDRTDAADLQVRVQRIRGNDDVS